MSAHRFISRLMGRVKRFFASRKQSDFSPPPANEKAPRPTKRMVRRPKPEEAGFSVARIENLKDLLDKVDSGIAAAHIDYRDGNLYPAEVRTLKRAGVSLVPYLRTRYELKSSEGCDGSENEQRMYLENPAHLPTTIMLGIDTPAAPDRSNPDYLFALRHPSLPWYVEKIRRPDIAVYRVGLAYRLYDDAARRQRTRNGVATQWMFQFVCIDKGTGEILLPRLWRWQKVMVNRHCCYARRERFVGTFPMDDIKCGGARVQKIFEANQTRALVAAAFDTADAARREWSVSISKGDDRMIVYINPHNAPTFFRHRDIEDGATKRRRIFHIVKGHERTLADGKRQWVREHSRGERAFSFKSYQCLITSPRFHVFAPGDFDVPPVDIVRKDGKETLDFEQVVDLVNDWIDTTPRRDLDGVAELKQEYR